MITLDKKKGLSKLDLNKKFDREFNLNINYKEKREKEVLYNFIMSKIYAVISSAYNNQYATDLQSALLEDIQLLIDKLEALRFEDKQLDKETIKFRNDKIAELRRLYEQIKNADNGNKPETTNSGS